CLVCGKSTSSTHLGMNVCRARNREIRDKLVCINVNPFRVRSVAKYANSDSIENDSRPNQNKYLH
ncbi:hypothetical protein PMAYCL1PPCAC_16693, partial [Pristionchus mayeri]